MRNGRLTNTQPQIDEQGTAELPSEAFRCWLVRPSKLCGSLFVNLRLCVRPSSVYQSAVPRLPPSGSLNE